MSRETSTSISTWHIGTNPSSVVVADTPSGVLYNGMTGKSLSQKVPVKTACGKKSK